MGRSLLWFSDVGKRRDGQACHDGQHRLSISNDTFARRASAEPKATVVKGDDIDRSFQRGETQLSIVRRRPPSRPKVGSVAAEIDDVVSIGVARQNPERDRVNHLLRRPEAKISPRAW